MLMDNKQSEEPPQPVLKSFMTVGPALHYSHKNVQRCWLLALGAFIITCLFWSKILTGTFWVFNAEAAGSAGMCRLGRYVITGVSIFEYPWQILVLGLLMGILAVVPVLVSQLMSFAYSIPFILAAALLANLPGFAIFLLISCIATASRPLRFRSRFVAIALCMAPELIYWGYFGGARGADPLKFGFSFTPWICAWLTSLAIAGVILGIGHFTRYKPGLVWVVTFVVLLIAVGVFDLTISFDELDYQLYVAKNNPEQITEFHDHSITNAIDETIKNPAVKKYLLAGYFYPTEPILLRAELKEKIQTQLAFDRWPSWLIVPPELKYQVKRQWLLEQYDLFINRRPTSRRMPIALYYKALLSEYSPDMGILWQKEILHFYNDYPYERSREIWYRLYSEFGGSSESLEARWRIAKHWAGQGRFDQADELLSEAQSMLSARLKAFEKAPVPADTLLSPFQPPAGTAMTAFKLRELQRKLNRLRSLIGKDNRTDDGDSQKRLARFAMLNPHSRRFSEQLDELLAQTSDGDFLRDNILLAKVTLIADEQRRAERLDQLHKKFQSTDGGMEALYQLALLKISFWRQQDDANTEEKKKYLTDARATLTSFLALYPDSFFAEQVKKNLDDLPGVE